jgi:AI-2 transport protein TqsA
VVLFLVSAFLAIIAAVPVHWMQRKRIPSVAAVLSVVAAMVVLLLSIGAVLGASLNDFSNALPSYQTRIHAMLFDLKALLARRGIAITDDILLGYINPGAVRFFASLSP